MKKRGLFGGIVLAALWAAFQVIAFSLPHTPGPAYWLGYAFTTLAILSQAVIAFWAFRDASRPEKLFYGLPIFRMGCLYLTVQTAFGLICLFAPSLHAWAAGAVSFLILVVYVILLAAAMKSRELVEKESESVYDRTRFIKTLACDAEALVSKAQDEEIRAAAKKVYEAVRYSDPLSTPTLAPIEEKLSAAFSALSKASGENNAAAFSAAAREFLQVLQERNTQCRQLK